MTVDLFYLSDAKFGGWVSYTAHLALALRACGIQSRVLRIGATTEAKVRPFALGVTYQNVTLGAARRCRGLITAVQWKHHRAAAYRLLELGNAITLHDPTEFDGAALEALRFGGTRVITIRRAVQKLLKQEHRLESTLIPHPYVRRVAGCNGHRQYRAVSLSRLDWDKNLDIIVGANQQLPEAQRIHVHGEMNRLYVFHKLQAAELEKQPWYHGRFGDAVDVARKAEYVVDMSTIANDGGGTQYTFLEAWDAGAALIVNRKWLRADDTSVREGDNVLAAGDAAELAACVQAEAPAALIAGGLSTLAAHAPVNVIPAYREVL